MWFYNLGFICTTAAEAVWLLGSLRCFSLKRNCLLRLEGSIISGSVSTILPG